jgi:hypothetical protein
LCALQVLTNTLTLREEIDEKIRNFFNLQNIEHSDIAILELRFNPLDQNVSKASFALNDSFLKLSGFGLEIMHQFIALSLSEFVPPFWWVLSKESWIDLNVFHLESIFFPNHTRELAMQVLRWNGELIPCKALLSTEISYFNGSLYRQATFLAVQPISIIS